MSIFDSAPPPLERRRAPVGVTVRVLLWRARFAVVAVCLGVAVSAAADAARPHPPPTHAVTVAAHPVGAGQALTAADVEVRQVPVPLAPVDAATAASDVVGSSAAVALTRGTPIVPGVLVPHDLAGPPGTVVAAVRLADPAMAHLLSAGMRVDVLAATTDGGKGAVVATRALVLPAPGAVDEGRGGLVSTSVDDAQPVLLAVAPDEVEALAVASASALLSAVVVP